MAIFYDLSNQPARYRTLSPRSGSVFPSRYPLSPGRLTPAGRSLTTLNKLKQQVNIGEQQQVQVKGINEPVKMYHVLGLLEEASHVS